MENLPEIDVQKNKYTHTKHMKTVFINNKYECIFIN